MPDFTSTEEKQKAIEGALTVCRFHLDDDNKIMKMLPAKNEFPNNWIGMFTYPDNNLLQKIKDTPSEKRKGHWQSDLALRHVEYIVTQLQAISHCTEGSQGARLKSLAKTHFKMQSHDNPTEAMETLTNPPLLNAAWGIMLFPDSWFTFPNDKTKFEALLGELCCAQVVAPYEAQNKAESFVTLIFQEETVEEDNKVKVLRQVGYAPVSDFALLEKPTGDQRTVILWGEYDSGNKRYDYRKGQAAAYCYTRLWRAIHDYCPRYTASLWLARGNTTKALRLNVFDYPSKGAEIVHYELTLPNGASCALHFLRILSSLLTKQQKQPTLSLSGEIGALKHHLQVTGVKSKNSKSSNSSNTKHPRDDEGSGGAGSSSGGGSRADSSNKRQKTDKENGKDKGDGNPGDNSGGSTGGIAGGSTCAASGEFFSDPETWTPLTKSTSAPGLNRGYSDHLSDTHSSQTTSTMTFSLVLDDPPAQWMTAADMIASASDDGTGGPCALIQTPSHDAPIAAAKLVKKQEIEILENLEHIRGVVKVIAAPYFGEDLWLLVTEYSGERLTDYVHSHASFPSPPLLPVLTQILDAVQEIHEAGYVHLDIKHDNIVVQASSHGNVATVLDFGHARSIVAGVPDTYGTEGWLAPEAYGGNVVSLTDLDTFSLGKVLLFAGENYRGADTSETQRNVICELGRAMSRHDPTQRLSIAQARAELPNL